MVTMDSPELKATRRTVKYLHDAERVGTEHDALVQLVLSTAEDYGDARRDGDTRHATSCHARAQAHQLAVHAP